MYVCVHACICIRMCVKSNGMYEYRVSSLSRIFYLPRPCCNVGAVVSLTTIVMLTVAATSRSKGRTTETCPVVRSTAKKSCKIE